MLSDPREAFQQWLTTKGGKDALALAEVAETRDHASQALICAFVAGGLSAIRELQQSNHVNGSKE